MTSVFKILEEVETTQGKNAKVEVLRPHVGNARLMQVMQLTHDPYVNFYIGKVPKVKLSATVTIRSDEDAISDLTLDRLLDALKHCMTGDLRGNAGKDLLGEILSGMTPLEHKWASRIILKKMRLGVGDGTIEKLWPGLLATFEVSLAKEIEWEVEGDSFKIITSIPYPVRLEPKWDGFRCIAVKAGGKVTLFARSGRIFETAPQINAALEKNMKDNWVLDGELMALEWNDTASIISAKKTKKDDSSVGYYVFDCMPLDTWRTQGVSSPYKDRLADIALVIGGTEEKSPVNPAEGIMANNEAELRKYYTECLERGFEGIMVKTLHNPYLFKRGTDVMKLKPVVTWDCVIVEVLEGKEGTKWEGTFSRIRVRIPNAPMLPDGLATTIVGTGFKDPDRAFLDENREKLVGRACEVAGQPPLSPDGKIRFPRFKRYREEWDISPEMKELIKEIKK